MDYMFNSSPSESTPADHNAKEHYPLPEFPPAYISRNITSPRRRFRSANHIAMFSFVAIALFSACWLMILIILHPTRGSWYINLLIFWVAMTYFVLPRLHQIFTFLYVPDYFIGRTRTNDGVLGDPVNLAFNGTESDLKAALAQAGWVEADALNIRSGTQIVLSTLRHTPYPSAPVSDLNLFGRKQNFSFQRDVDGTTYQRHHIRFWRVPAGWRPPGGEKVDWVAAASFDRAVGINFFTLQATHRIDADIDAERNFVINTIRYADPHCTVSIIEHFSTSYYSWNGGGDLIVTDGHLPVVDVSQADQRSPYNSPETRPHSHALPPVPLWFAAVFFTLLITTAAYRVMTFQPYGWAYAGLAAILGALLFLTFRRRRWAWFTMMGYSALVSTLLLFATSWTLLPEESTFSVVGLTVLFLVTIADEKILGWVHERRRKHIS